MFSDSLLLAGFSQGATAAEVYHFPSFPNFKMWVPLHNCFAESVKN